MDDEKNQSEGSGALIQLRIREAAYLLWEAAGSQHGRCLEFWLAAEREVLTHANAEPAPEERATPDPAPARAPEGNGSPPH